MSEFDDEVSTEVKATIFSEFNTLSVVYGMPSSTFISAGGWSVALQVIVNIRELMQQLRCACLMIAPFLVLATVLTTSSSPLCHIPCFADHLITPLDADQSKGAGNRGAASGEADDDRLLQGGDDEGGPPAQPLQHHAAAAQQQQAAPEVDLLGDDLLGMGLGSAPAPAAAGSGFGGLGIGSAAPAPVTLRGAPQPLDPAAFQGKWGSQPVTQTFALRAGRVPATGEVEGHARAGGILTIASGDVGTHLKFYVYGQDSTGSYHLMEVVLDKSNGAVQATMKSDNAANAGVAAAAFAAAMRPIPMMMA